MGYFNQRSDFKHAQNVQIHIILCMRKVLPKPLLSIYTFCSIQWQTHFHMAQLTSFWMLFFVFY